MAGYPKCRICRAEADWTWQPFGPADSLKSSPVPGARTPAG